MKKIMIAVFICLVSGCSIFGNNSSEIDSDSPQNLSACDDSYNSVDDRCAGSITPQTY